MSACRRNEALISRYVDNDLATAEAQSLEKHIAGCSRCRRALESFRKMKRLVELSFDYELIGYQSSTLDSSHPVLFLQYPAVWKLATLLIIVLFAGIEVVSHRSRPLQNKVPIVMQGESRRIFNTPLGAVIYYEDLAGTTIHTQYSKIDTALQLACSGTNEFAEAPVPGYSSEIFHDNSYVSVFYSITRN